MKTFGLVVPAGKGSTFERHVRDLLADHAGLAAIILPLLEAWRSMRLRAAELGRQLVAGARQSEACQLLMSIPGVGVDHRDRPSRRPSRTRTTSKNRARSALGSA